MAKLEPRLTVRAVRPLVSGLAAMGHDPAPILTAVGVESATLDDPDAQVPVSVGVSFLARAVEATGENALVLPAPMLDLPCVGADPMLLSAFDRHATDRLEITSPKRDRSAVRGSLAGIRLLVQ